MLEGSVSAQQLLSFFFFERCMMGDANGVSSMLESARGTGGTEALQRYKHPRMENYTPLHAASDFGRVEVIQVLLLHEGADLEARTEKQSTPLHLASLEWPRQSRYKTARSWG